jgi:FlaA1/EpsC-like NDP-sugar epimerase
MNASSDRRPGGTPPANGQYIVNRPQDAPKGSRRLRWLSVGTDIVAVATSVGIGLTPALGWDDPIAPPQKVRIIAMLVVLNIIVFALNRLYLARTASLRTIETATLLRAVLISTVIALAVRPNIASDVRVRRVVLIQSVVFFGVMIGRHAYRMMLKRSRRHGRFMRPVVLVGAGDEAFELLKILRDEPELGFDVRGIVGEADAASRLPFEVPYLGSADEVVANVLNAGA